jgi:TPR repeat protein
MSRIFIYLLPVLIANQVLCGNEGSRWLKSDLSSLTNAADSGDAFAQGFLALCHLHGDKNLNISFLEARFYAENSASRGHWLGNFVLGHLARYKPMGPNSDLVAKYLFKSFRDPDGKLIKQAAIGDPVALYVLAEIFTAEEVQTILKQDMQMAAEYYSVSANSGYAPACVQSALIKLHDLSNSLVGDEDANKQRGINLLQQGIDQKLPGAHHYLGRCYLEGLGVKEDKSLALVHFQAAADRGFGLSLLMVADFYAYGLTGSSREDLAYQYAEKALEVHQAGAEEKLNEYEKLFNPAPKIIETENISIDKEKTDSWTTPVETNSNSETDFTSPVDKPFRLPSLYGKTEPANTDPVPEPIKETARIPLPGKSTQSQPALLPPVDQIREDAKKVYWGSSKSKSMEDAFKSFEKCANLGDAESARYLGIMYLRGKGISKNVDEALKWLEVAAKRGDGLAEKNLLSLRKIMKK